MKMNHALTLIQQYKISTKSYTTICSHEIHDKIPNVEKSYASIKLDGHQYSAVYTGQEIYFQNSSGKIIKNIPVLERLEKLLKGRVKSIVLVGELTYKPVQGKRARASELNKVINCDPIPGVEHLYFEVFDVLQINDITLWPCDSFLGRQETLDSLFNTIPGAEFHCNQVPVSSEKHMRNLYQKIVNEQGHEGVMVVCPGHNRVFKIKPQHSIDAVVIGFTEDAARPGTVDSLLTALMDSTGTIITLGSVRTGLHILTDKEHAGLFDRLSNLIAPTNYKTTNSHHVVYTMVRPEIVAQLFCNDAIMSTGNEPLKSPAFEYHATYNSYEYRGQHPLASPVNLVFADFRPDKEASYPDVRAAQLDDVTGEPRVGLLAMPLPQSSLLERHVYTREVSGSINVRKFMAWRTNKDTVDPDYPPYVICYIDYSPTRKEQPIKRYVRPAQSSKDAHVLIQELIECKIKRGWTLQDASHKKVVN